MEYWRYQYPSVSISRKNEGDFEYAERFRGEAYKLLYELKNLMKFRNLGQLKMTRYFYDGKMITAKITAKSIFGQDFLEISTSAVIPITDIAPEEQCTITLIDIPESVQPMKNPGQIRSDEIEGVDFIKTYYLFDIGKCQTCTEIESNLSFTFENASLPGVSGDPNNHCLYSISPPCWGEVIDQGTDQNGSYFRWKAYTETNEYSRTGQGYIRLKLSIDSAKTDELCQAEQVIPVDCCKKDVANRTTLMYWQKCDFMNDWCPVPDEPQSFYTLSFFWQYLDGLRYISLRADPERSGSCPQYTWQNSGDGTLKVSSDTLSAILYLPPESTCWDRFKVKVQDRCGTFDVLEIGTCCDEMAGSLVLSYTSLQMSCNTTQSFTVTGGCPPYFWSLSGGGGFIAQSPSGDAVIYQAPSSNEGCANNATISVRDCCGMSQSVQVAINCYEGAGNAYAVMKCRWALDNCQNWDWGLCGIVGGCYTVPQYVAYDCNGDLSVAQTDGEPCGAAGPANIEKECGSGACGDCCSYFGVVAGKKSLAGCPTEARYFQCDDYCDLRTELMKQQGCCLINPFTGLPF